MSDHFLAVISARHGGLELVHSLHHIEVMLNGTIKLTLSQLLFALSILTPCISGLAGNGESSTAPAITPRLEVARIQAWRTWNANEIAWVSTSEVAVDHFIVERSTDGTSFQEIAVLSSRGSDNRPVEYQHQDEKSPAGNCFYRIRAIAQGGQDWVFESQEVAARLTVAPQIFVEKSSSDQIWVNIESVREARVCIFDRHGQTILRTDRKAESGSSGIQTGFDLSNSLHGPYWVEVRLPDGTTLREAFIR